MAHRTESIRHDDLRPRNRGVVIAALRKANSLSRTDLADRTKLSHSTISAISADLISEGILREQKGNGQTKGRRGRPQVALGLDPAAGLIVTAVLSLDRFAAALIDYAGEIVLEESVQLSTATIRRDRLIETVIESLAAIMQRSPDPDARIFRIVMAIQGVTDAKGEMLLWSPITPHDEIPFSQILQDRFNIPATVENDCSMTALALQWRDPQRYGDNFIALLLSHGIGMGLVLRGDLFQGTRSSAGEFGHMNHIPGGALCRCGRRGCIEAYSGNYALWRRARGLPTDQMPAQTVNDTTIRALIEQARHEDGSERAALAEAATAIGYGLGSLFALIDPAPVAVFGTGSAALDLMEPVIRDALAQTAGGEHSSAISFTVEGDEMPLIREGCAIRALTLVDEAITDPTNSAVPGRLVQTSSLIE